MMRTHLLHILLVISFLLTSCSKEKECDDPLDCLPPITQTGANIAGCLINGELLLPGGGGGINTGNLLTARYNFSGDDDSVFSLSIRVARKRKECSE